MKPLTGKQVCKLLRQNGWALLRISGSHWIYGKDGEEARITVPVHANKELKRGLLLAILKAAGLE